MQRPEYTDGLDALRSQLSLPEILRLIERTARWVAPETFERLPVWYPEHSRKGLFYKANWSEPQLNTNQQTGASVHKFEGNNYANKALTGALGLRSTDRPNWSCCHIWGLDDATYGTTNLIVQDNRFYTCVANMVLLPTPLKAFTDVMPDVKKMLRACAFYLYDWQCDHPELQPMDLAEVVEDEGYPTSWPRPGEKRVPLGIVPINSGIAQKVERRRSAIKFDLENAGSFYPREKVLSALKYWNVHL